MRRPRLLALLTAVLGVARPLSAHAQDDTVSMPLPYAEDIVPPPGLHRGLYLRASAGLSQVLSWRTIRARGMPDRGAYTHALAGSAELSVGGAPIPGFIVAGSLFSQLSPSPRTRLEGQSRPDAGSLSLHMAALTLGWYPGPLGGTHLGGSLGLALARSGDGPPEQSLDARGPAVAIAVGKDMAVGDRLAVGILGRFIAMAATERGDHRDAVDSPYLVCSASALVSVAYLGSTR